VTALTGVALEVGWGEVVGLVGANGSGKTTLLHVAAGLVAPDEGSVEVCGARAGSVAARRHVALVPDEPAGFDELTVAELVALVGALYAGDDAAAARADDLLDAFDLRAWRRAPVGALSHGRRRQAALVAAFAVAPSLALVDEAVATLDPRAAAALVRTLRAHAASGRAALLATQDLRFADEACDRLLVLAGGSVVAAGSPGALAAGRRVEEGPGIRGRSEGGACVAPR
jgi:ABC-type multidrug transport system ATPase subunit